MTYSFNWSASPEAAFSARYARRRRSTSQLGILRLRDVIKADADGSVLEDRTEEPLTLLQGFLGTLAFRDVFVQGDEVLWLACGVPEQLKPPVADDDAAVAADEAVLVLVRISLTLNDSCIPFRVDGAFLDG
jgi:hypothetical protein